MSNKMRKKSSQSGFTLMEMMVVITVFSLTTLIVVDLFILVSRLQRRVTEQQKLTSDTRLIMESMARTVHGGTIDYDYYQVLGVSLDNPVTVLATRDPDNNQTVYRRSSAGVGDDIEVCRMSASDSDQQKCLDPSPDPGDWQTANTDDTAFQSLLLYIRPTGSPFELLNDNSGLYVGGNVQPRVTFVFHAQNNPATPTSEIHDAYLQTTVTSRWYLR